MTDSNADAIRLEDHTSENLSKALKEGHSVSGDGCRARAN